MMCALHHTAVKALTKEWRQFGTLANAGNHTTFEDLVSFGLAERRIEKLFRGEVVCGSKTFYRLKGNE